MVDSVVPAAFQTEKEPEVQWEGVIMGFEVWIWGLFRVQGFKACLVFEVPGMML